MEPPAITRSRRPFLLPVWLTLSSVLVFLIAALLTYFIAHRLATTTIVVLARHAEQEAGVIQDPPLSAEGERRAERLAQMFGRVTGVGRLDAIYVSDARRTQQTAAPLAEVMGRQPVVIPAADVKGTAARIMREHTGGVVLVVGHNSNVPALIHALTGFEVPMPGGEDYDTLYVVGIPTFGRANVLRMEY